MDYKVLSENIEHPLLKPVLEELIPVFEQRGIKFYLIGAVARDIILDLNKEKSDRVTMDLDIAIAINKWEDFENISADILALPSFSKDIKQQQKFLYQSKYQIDIVPYGGIKDQNDIIYWPPDESFAMSVMGFEEAEKNVLQINLDDELLFEVASVEGVFLLKLFAWKDRYARDSRDAEDIGFILNIYFHMHRDQSHDPLYNKVYDLEKFTVLKAGAKMLGIKLNKVLNSSENVRDKVKSLLEEEIKKEEESKLINQIIETNRNLKFDDVQDALHLINIQIK